MCDLWIRAGTAVDADALIGLEKAVFAQRSWPGDSIAGCLSTPNVWVAIAGFLPQKADGFLVWRRIADEAEILSLGVLPAVRGRGLARALLHDMQCHAVEKGLHRVILEVDSQNMPALALYRSAGYHPIGERRHYYRDGADATVMARMLRA